MTNAITTTRYTLDLAAGLTQVLVDGDFTYLYGNGRVAQSGASGTEYFRRRKRRCDALGSVRQLVDSGGEVTLAQSYTPYGEVLATEGEATTSYAFTGEALDAYTGLVYLRARWYGPSWGRFLSRDVWEGDYQRPASYNLWLYGYANPVIHTDPAGEYAIPGPCHRFCGQEVESSTKWLIEEMRKNSLSREAVTIQLLNNIANAILPFPASPIVLPPIFNIPPIVGTCGVPLKGIAYFLWIEMVKTDAPWDFKKPILRKDPGFGWGGEYYQMCCGSYSYETPSNIHYGYVGLASGFTALELKAGAGAAQYLEHRKTIGYQERLAAGEVGWHTYYDEPEDAAGIEIGMELYKHRWTLTPNKFCQIFSKHAHLLKKEREGN